MSICVVCSNEFVLPKSNRLIDNLIFSQNNDVDEYMCPDCYDLRANSDFRYHDGQILCASNGCGRNAMTFSKYCFKCDGINSL